MAIPGTARHRSAELSSGEVGRVQRLQVIVKEETPFLPKVAFTLITVASLAGAILTGNGLGVHGAALVVRWFGLWTLALAGGFLAWRLAYLRHVEADLDRAVVYAFNDTALSFADRVARVLAPLVAIGATAPLAASYLAGRPAVRFTLLGATVLLAALLAGGVRRRAVAGAAAASVALLLAGWAYADAGNGGYGWIRLAHLTAFSLWLGGALWNIAVAMRAGRAHPVVDAVLAGARQLDRFRWVVRFVFPTIIGTGLAMADVYRALPRSWWLSYPGVLIFVKIGVIVALVAVFIACPLFRHCSPVRGVCNIDDLRNADADEPLAEAEPR
jgi:putative copper resistance protein D